MPRNVTVTFGDGTSHVYNGVPDDATPQQVEARASQEFGKQVTGLDGGSGATPQSPSEEQADHQARLAKVEADLKAMDENKPGFGTAAWEITKNYLKGLGDTVANLGSSTIATPVAGLAGTVTAGVTAPFVGVDKAMEKGANVVRGVSEALTYQPRSDVGKEAQQNIAKPFEMLANAGDQAGQVVADLAPNSKIVRGIATGINTGVQALPAIILRKGGVKAPVASGTAAAEEGAATTAARAAANAEQAIPPKAPTAVESPAPTPPPKAATATVTEPPAVTKAKAYAADRMGVDWNSLPKGVQQKLTSIAQTAKGLDNLDPVAVAREAKFQSLPEPVPATRGQLTRDPVALRNEGNVSATSAGAPIREVHDAQNAALIKNLDILRDKVSGQGKAKATATTAEETGGSIQGAARAKLEAKQKQVKGLYDEAEAAGEMQGQVSTRGLVRLLETSPGKVHLTWVDNWLKKMDVSKETGPQSKGRRLTLSLKELEDLRQDAVAEVMNPNAGRAKKYAGQVIEEIDKATEGAGGAKYKQARAAFKEMKREFEDQGAVADLVSDASRTDRATALEGTTRAITNGSLEDVRKVKRTLLTGGDATTRLAGKKAWNDLKRQVIQGIKDEATKGVAVNTDGTPNLTAAGLKRAIDKYGPDKLNEIFGSGTARQLDRILDVTRDAKTVPPSRVAGSSTVANVLAFLEKGITKIPGGGVLADVARGAAKVRELGAAGREAKKATTTPLNEALAKAAQKTRNDKIKAGTKKVASKTVPLSSIGAQSQPRR